MSLPKPEPTTPKPDIVPPLQTRIYKEFSEDRHVYSQESSALIRALDNSNVMDATEITDAIEAMIDARISAAKNEKQIEKHKCDVCHKEGDRMGFVFGEGVFCSAACRIEAMKKRQRICRTR